MADPIEDINSIPGVCSVERVGAADGPCELLIELPHGATRAAHFDALVRRLHGDYADDLREFFFVNTDVGAPECARAIAGRLAARRRTLIVSALLPRTFVDCNRLIEFASADGHKAMTPHVPPYVTDERDVALLVERYQAYHRVARRAYEEICGAGGMALTLHTYAPRSVDIGPIDEDVVRKLHEAYEPERFLNWPRRPDVDVISEDADGRRLAPESIVGELKREYEAIGIRVTENETYRLYPASMGFVYSAAHPGRVLCLEINRELLADPFDPFREMRVGVKKATRMATPIAAAIEARLPV